MTRISSLPGWKRYSSLPRNKGQRFYCDDCGRQIMPNESHYRKSRGSYKQAFYRHIECYKKALQRENERRRKIVRKRKLDEEKLNRDEKEYKRRWS